MRKLLQTIFSFVFKKLAQIALWRHRPKIVAVTGNIGKTTTKDIIIAVLASKYHVGGTIRSQNSHLTTPLSILGLEVASKERSARVWSSLLLRALVVACMSRRFPEVLVIELGAGEPGDIDRLSSWLRPHISVFTALQKYPVHLSYFSDRDELFREKKTLAKHTRPGGTIVFNGGDEFLAELLRDCPQHKISAGKSGRVVLEEYTNTRKGLEARIALRGVSYKVMLDGVWGKSYAYSLCLACGVAMDLGVDISDVAKRVHHAFIPSPGRMRILQGIHGSVVIDDSYNASPAALKSALETLAHKPFSGRVICVLGDMGELGENADQAHREAGIHVAEVADVFVSVGTLMRHATQSAKESGMSEKDIFTCEDSKTAGTLVKRMLRSGDVILLKASRHSMQMERALVQLVEAHEQKNLVQEYL